MRLGIRGIFRYPPLSYVFYVLRRFRYLFRRIRIGWRYARGPLFEYLKWVPKRSESDNFYYRITDSNKAHLAWMISHVSGVSPSVARGYIDELDEDHEFRSYLQQRISARPDWRDVRIEFGRRLGWYAFVRALKPRVVIETGVHHGVGACVLCRALQRNTDEGAPGRYYGTEILESFGFLLDKPYSEYGQIVYGDSLETLSAFSEPIDLFINDSDHDAGYEYREYQAIAKNLSDQAIMLGDNAHVSNSLARFAEESGRSFLFWSERPEGHFYPGAGIGICFTEAREVRVAAE